MSSSLVRRALLSVVLLAAGCRCTPTECAATCDGCCDSSGECQPGITANACGQSGLDCAVCSTTQQCLAAVCMEGTGGGGGGGGATGGGGGTSAVPVTPTNLVASASPSSVTLTWSHPTTDETGFELERRAQPVAAFSLLLTPSAGATSAQDPSVVGGTIYDYRVRALNAVGASAWSNVASARVPTSTDTTPPSTPTNLTSNGVTSTQVDLSWGASTDDVGVTGYRLERCQGAGCADFTQFATPTDTGWSDPGRTPSTSYSYRVRARDAAGNTSGYSNTFLVVTPAGADTTPPTTPTNLASTSVTSAQINLAWGASSDNVAVTGYRLERCQGAACGNFAEIATPIATSYSDPGRAASTSYSYRVRARDAAGNNSGFSNTYTVVTAAAADTTPPTAPTNLTSTSVTSTQINLTWVASTDNVAVTGYRLERCQGAGCRTFAEIATPSTNSFSDAGRTPSTSYSYRVRARDAVDNTSEYSNIFSVVTSGGSVCTANVTRCVAGSIGAVDTCNGSGTAWVRGSCPPWTACSNAACRTICDITFTPTYPTSCLYPNNDGVNNGNWLTWSDSSVANNHVTGGVQLGSSGTHLSTASGTAWPYAWDISRLDDAYMQFHLNQFSGTPRLPRLVFRAKRAGIFAGSVWYRVFVFRGPTLADTFNWTNSVSLTWELADCQETNFSLLDYGGGWNYMRLTVQPFGDPGDFINVNYLRLEMRQ